MRSYLLSVILFASSAFAQQTINPASQIKWPKLSGVGAPTAACRAANYAQPYLNTATNQSYICTPSGWILQAGSSGGGLSSFNVGNLSPLFTASLGSLPLTNPALAFSLSNAPANSVFGNFTGSTGLPSYSAAPVFSAANLTNFPTFNQSTTGNAATASALAGTPTLCGAGLAPTGILPNGNATGCQSISSGGITALTGDATASGSGPVAVTVTKVNGTSLAALSTGILKNTTTTGVPSIAIASDFPTLNQSTTGNAATATVATSALAAPYSGLTGSVPTWNQSTTGTAAGISGSQTANFFLAAPNGSAGAGSFRAIVAADIPALSYLASSTQLPVTIAVAAHNFLTSYASGTGAFTAAQPAFTDISGTLGTAQGPSGLTGLLKDTAGTLSAATAGTDYLTPTGSSAGLSVGSTSAFGVLKADGVSCTTSSGVLSCTGSGGGFTALTGDVTASGVGSVAATVVKINGTSLAALATGILKNTTSTGVPSIAVVADFPTLNQNTTGTAANITGVLNATSMPAFTGDVTKASGSVATTVAKINGVAMSGLATGIVKNTTTTGVPSIAVAADFPTLNQSTTGSAATLTTARTIAGTSFNGSTNIALANKFILQGTADAGLSGAQFLGALSTGLLKNTTTTGVLSAAVAGTDYLAPTGSAAGLTSFPTFNQSTTGNAATATLATNASAVGGVALSGLCQTGGAGCPSSGTGISGLTPGFVPLAATPTTITANSHIDEVTNPGSETITQPVIIAAVSGAGGGFDGIEGTAHTCTAGTDSIWADATSHAVKACNNGGAAFVVAGGASKGSCTEAWGGSGTSFALTSGDDAISNNTCYNDSGVTRTITAVKCRSSIASNTTTVNPTFGSAGTGTTILSGALTCGSSLAYSSTGTVTNASWTTGSGITPAMGGTLTGVSIAMIVEYTF